MQGSTGESDDLVDWQSKLLSTVSTSSAGAEVCGLSAACKRLIWLRRLLTEAGFTQEPTVVYEDNTAAIKTANTDAIADRMRHLHVSDLFVREMRRNDEIVIKYIKSCDNLADFLTKIQPVALFRKMRDRIMGIKL